MLNQFDKKQKIKLFTSISVLFIVGALFLIICSNSLINSKEKTMAEWDSITTENQDLVERANLLNEDATEVKVGMYIEDLKEVSLKNGSFRINALVWFNWEGDEDYDFIDKVRFYKGTILKDNTYVVESFHEDGTHYQLIRYDVTIAKKFTSTRFPLDDHVINIYLESPVFASEVRFVQDEDPIGINHNVSLMGYQVADIKSWINAFEYGNAHGDQRFSLDETITEEFAVGIRLERTGIGLYVKCFIALWGTILWVLISVFLTAYHKQDTLSMMPGALFGAVSNIMVGANLLPDVLSMGLLEYENILGIGIIIAATVIIINVNRIRATEPHNEVFAAFFAKAHFYLLSILSILGVVLLPYFSM